MYDYKRLEELAWFVGISVGIFVLTEIAGHADFSDWRAWLPVVGGGALRAAAGAALAVIARTGGVK
jgi:phage terminase large subunit-like protein